MSSAIIIESIQFFEDPSNYFSSIECLGKRAWLDSGKPKSQKGRFDILTAAPREILVNANNNEVSRAVHKIANGIDFSKAEALEIPFCGGALGYQSYPRSVIQTPSETLHTNTVAIYDWALIQDHTLKQSYLIFLPCCKEQTKIVIRNLITAKRDNVEPTPSTLHCSKFKVKNLNHDMTKDQYMLKIKKIQEYLLSGDVYQVNLSQRFSGDFEGSPAAAYLTLRSSLPSPYSGYFEFGNATILSVSPERFISINSGAATTQPIKGTAPRGKTIEEDAMLADSLQKSVKNRAENLMIVDLLRNDFNQFCKPFSVKTPKLFELESYANVHHLVSTVTGELKDSVHPLEFFSGSFPGGSITGAPKKRAMEIIEELESDQREIYCGSMYYLSAHGNFDSNITIRTIMIKNEKLYCWGGGGVVFDSSAEEEYQECLNKIGLILDTLENNTSLLY